MSINWYVLHCKPNKENILHQQLQYREIEHFYPTLKIKPVNPRSRKILPYFPGYMFVHLDLVQSQAAFNINWLPGADNLVSFDGQPAEVPDQLISTLRKNLLMINENNKKNNLFANGDKVKILHGPFEGYEGIFDVRHNGQERAQILIGFLKGKTMRVEIPLDQLKKVPN